MEWHKIFRKIQVDPSSHCNARCGACARNITGGEKVDFLPLDHFPMDIWERMVVSDLKNASIEKLTLNGNWGDAGMNPNIQDMVKLWTKHHQRASVMIATNGGMNNESWWAKFAPILRQASNHRIQFAVDGLEDTHSLYRRRTDFKKVISNIKSFADAGGNAQIIWTIFDHNVHQIEQGAKLAEELGCVDIRVRRSFSEHMHIQDKDENYKITTEKVKDLKGFYKQFHPRSDMPQNDTGVPPLEETFDYSTGCPWYNQGEIQIDPWGTVWPCCHTSIHRYADRDQWKLKDNKNLMLPVLNYRNDTYGADRFSLNKHTLDEILSGTFFNVDVKEAVEKGKWWACQTACDRKAV